MAFGLVEKPVGTLDLLVYLLRHGRTSMNTIQADTGMGKETFYRAVDRLKSLGFVYQEEETGFPTHVYLGLTRTGESVARALLPVADLLASTARSLAEELDSLEEANQPITKLRRIELLGTIAEQEFSSGRWGPTREKAARLIELAHETKEVRSEALGRIMLGRILQKQDAHEEAFRELESAGRLARDARLADLASDVEYLLGSDLERQGRWAEALDRFTRTAELAFSAPDALRSARARLGTGRVLGRQGKLEESAAILREAVAEFERLGAEEELPRAYSSLGATLHHMNRPDNVEWFEKAIVASRRCADPRMEAHGIANAAAHWIDARQFRKAEAFLRRAQATFQELEERSGLTGAELNLGILCAEEGRWMEAEEHFDRATTLARETGNQFQAAYVLFNRGKMMRHRNRRIEARALLEEAGRIFTELGSRARVARCEEELRDLTKSGTR